MFHCLCQLTLAHSRRFIRERDIFLLLYFDRAAAVITSLSYQEESEIV